MVTQLFPTSDMALVDAARKEVLDYLHAESRFPRFLEDLPPGTLRKLHERIVDRFCEWVEPSGFTLHASDGGTLRERIWVAEWRVDGAAVAEIPGSDAAQEADAKLLACAALLRHPATRSRLPA